MGFVLQNASPAPHAAGVRRLKSEQRSDSPAGFPTAAGGFLPLAALPKTAEMGHAHGVISSIA